MKSLSVVVAQGNRQSAEILASSLHGYFREVSVAGSLEELRNSIPKHRADLAVVDLELVNLDEVRALHGEFGHTMIVCTHRFPDETMWQAALSAGAADFCYNADVRGILDAASRHRLLAWTPAA